MKPLFVKISIIIALGLVAGQAGAATDRHASATHLVKANGTFTQVAGIPAALVDNRIVLFVEEGQGRAPVAGDTIVCNKMNQDVTEMARRFRSNPFTQVHAETLDRLEQRGYTVLDGGCVIDRSAGAAINLFRALGGVLDDIAVPYALLPEREQ